MNKIIMFFCIAGLLFSCSKSSNTSTAGVNFFPSVPVNLQININLPQYSALTQIQGWVYETGGYKGLIIYHTINDVYVAFDRTCPVNSYDTCAYVSMDSSRIYFICSKAHILGIPCSGSNAGICNSKFLPDNGFPISGPAKVPLKQYLVRFDGNYIYITNNQ